MIKRMVAPPAALAVSMVDAKEALRIDEDDTSRDTTITLLIEGITAEVEHETGRAFVNRAMRVTLNRFPPAICLSAPTLSVEAVTYRAPNGAAQTLPPADYYLDKESAPGYIVPGRGKAWPATEDFLNAVTVDYTAGYGADHTAVPKEVRAYILAKLQVQFEATAGAGTTVTKPFNVEYLDRLLDRLRTYSL